MTVARSLDTFRSRSRIRARQRAGPVEILGGLSVGVSLLALAGVYFAIQGTRR